MMDYVKRGGEFVVVLKTNELYICIYGHFKLQECEKKGQTFFPVALCRAEHVPR
jgi:hypothetical protein